jgi:hypothetical protein
MDSSGTPMNTLLAMEPALSLGLAWPIGPRIPLGALTCPSEADPRATRVVVLTRARRNTIGATGARHALELDMWIQLGTSQADSARAQLPDTLFVMPVGDEDAGSLRRGSVAPLPIRLLLVRQLAGETLPAVSLGSFTDGLTARGATARFGSGDVTTLMETDAMIVMSQRREDSSATRIAAPSKLGRLQAIMSFQRGGYGVAGCCGPVAEKTPYHGISRQLRNALPVGPTSWA